MTNKQDGTVEVMLDIETLGTGKDAQIIQIGAGAFRLDKRVVTMDDFLDVFEITLDLHTVDSPVIDVDTLIFWTKEPENAETFNKLLDQHTGITEEQMALDFHNWLTQLQAQFGKVTLWGNGIIFDNVKIEALFEKHGLVSPIKYSMHGDVRTITRTACDKLGMSLDEFRGMYADGIEKHNALADVLYQARYVTRAYEELAGKFRGVEEV